MNWMRIVFAGLLLVFVSSNVLPAFAEDDIDDIEAIDEDHGDRRAELKQRMEELRKLKETDPAAFEAKMKERRENVRARLEKLKTEDPEKYRKIMERRHHKMKERMEHMKETDPEKYKEIVEKRHEWREEKLEELKTTDPDRYAKIMAKRQRWEEEGRPGPR